MAACSFGLCIESKKSAQLHHFSTRISAHHKNNSKTVYKKSKNPEPFDSVDQARVDLSSVGKWCHFSNFS